MDVRGLFTIIGAVTCLGLVACDSPGSDGDTDTDVGTDTDVSASASSEPDDPSESGDDPEPSDDDDAGSSSPPDDDDGTPPDTDGQTDDSGPGNGDESGSGETGDPPEQSDCCEARDEPSCSDDTVALCVCDEQVDCCVTGWSAECAEIAAASCGACEGEPAGDACSQTHTIELDASSSMLTGGWWHAESEVGEGAIAAFDLNHYDGTVTWDVDIPCEDTWQVWVRVFDEPGYDSYFVRLDGEPASSAIFEGECAQENQGYSWRQLNQRDESAPPCTHTDDPWAPEWAAGPHEVEFGFREARALARIIVVNDPSFVP